MPRFFVAPSQIGETQIQLDAEIQAHIKVLRLRPDETFIITDGAGKDYICKHSGDAAQILSQSENQSEPAIKCVVYLAYTKGERMEYAIQKSVELGAVGIMLYPSHRCVARYDAKTLPKKHARFEKIAQEAAKQSGRGLLPEVKTLPSFKQAAEEAAKAEKKLFLYEQERTQTLKAALNQGVRPQTISLFIGPEGGFTECEAKEAIANSLQSVSLGRRILRAETAPVAALAAVMFWAGEL